MKKIKFLLLGLGLIMITTGIINEEMAVVFNKAIKICFECIGLG